jgi:peptide/nickel transport system ATP-binding protein
VGIVGESGCGKTTLARAILGFIEPSAGTISFKEKQYNSTGKRNQHQEIQMVFQDPYASLNPRIQIGKAVEEPLLVHEKFKRKQDAHEYVNELLKKVGLDPYYYQRYPHQISGGQILNLINELKHTDQFSSLFISHDLSVVKYLCDRVYIMQKGKIVEEGDPEIIWKSPQHPYTIQLLDAIPGRNR